MRRIASGKKGIVSRERDDGWQWTDESWWWVDYSRLPIDDGRWVASLVIAFILFFVVNGLEVLFPLIRAARSAGQ